MSWLQVCSGRGYSLKCTLVRIPSLYTRGSTVPILWMRLAPKKMVELRWCGVCQNWSLDSGSNKGSRTVLDPTRTNHCRSISLVVDSLFPLGENYIRICMQWRQWRTCSKLLLSSLMFFFVFQDEERTKREGRWTWCWASSKPCHCGRLNIWLPEWVRLFLCCPRDTCCSTTIAIHSVSPRICHWMFASVKMQA